jgi:hypothetical protein
MGFAAEVRYRAASDGGYVQPQPVTVKSLIAKPVKERK